MFYIYYLIVFVVTLLFLALYLKTSRHYHWFDQPGDSRKLHIIAKPTSAGIIFMLPCALLLILFPDILPFGTIQIGYSLLFLIVLGGVDDFIPTSAKIRFIAITLLSAWMLYTIDQNLPINRYLGIIYLLGLIWWINLYNFMDGADGMAALHAMASLVGYFIIYVSLPSMELFMILNLILLLFLCVLSFLLFNFPTAKMFMGDSGSLSIAFILAVIAMYGLTLKLFDEIMIISFHLIFIVDATLTLFTRLKYKHKLTQAHNLHYFQALIESGKSHAYTSLLYLFITVITIGIALLLHFRDTEWPIRLAILLLETIILSYFWYKFHHKTNFKRFVK
jgi:UDP-N-acetylmuramyl pentapeptide phosphotransferase/UDP-N-acetylglucosamine-1-phosphate transferase